MDLVEEYTRECERYKVKKPNRDVIEQLKHAGSAEGVEVLDLSTTYVGWRGLLPVLEVAARCPNLSTLLCGPHNAELSSDNDAVPRMMEVARTHPALTSLSFAGNPVTAFGAHHLLALAADNPQVLQLQLDDPLADPTLLQRINEALEANMAKASASEPVRRKTSDRSTDPGAGCASPSAKMSPRNRRRTGVSAEVFQHSPSDEDYRPMTVPKDEEVEETLRACLLRNPLFSHLQPAELDRFIAVMYRTTWQDGDEIIRVGTPGENLYVVTRGHVDVLKGGKVVAIKEVSQLFGELELMYDALACATVKAVGEVEAYAITRRDYQHVMIGEMTQRRKNHVDFLSRIPFTRDLNTDEKLQIADALQSKHFAAGEVVMHQGEPGDTMYIVVEGRVAMQRATPDGQAVDLGTRGPGEYFGEFEFLFHVERFCTITATEPLRTLYITKRDFEYSMGPVMDILRRNTTVYRFYVSEDGKPADRAATQA